MITAEMNDIEKRYSETLEQVELENSMLSDHEIWHKQVGIKVTDSVQCCCKYFLLQ